MSNVIAGTGMICSVGDSPESCFNSMIEGVSGVDAVSTFETDNYDIVNAYEISNSDLIRRATRWLIWSINQAVENASLTPEELEGVPVYIGTGLRELRTLELWRTRGIDFNVEELHFKKAVRDAYPQIGQVYTLSNACSASNFALGLADDRLKYSDESIAIVAGTDSIAESMYGVTSLTSKPNLQEVQPFDEDRKGVLLGEGATAVILEKEESAKTRGIPILARLKGVSMNCDAHHETAPSFDGLLSAMEQVHERCQMSVNDIDLIITHGTGTQLNDDNESQVIAKLFSSSSNNQIHLAAIKSMTGHTSGAAALSSLVMGIFCLLKEKTLPFHGLDNPIDTFCDSFVLPTKSSTKKFDNIQVNASGFGGINSISIIQRYQ